MADGGGFSPDEVIALLASHTAHADHVDATLSFFLEVLLKGVGIPGTPNNSGEALSPLPVTQGVDGNTFVTPGQHARGSFINEQEKMSSTFKAAMAKRAIIGNERSELVDCSEAAPEPVPASGKPAHCLVEDRADHVGCG
ncbi:hypothetical protein JB92DRAFT_3124180 [Gautieria morchelliformis]|nr:hypothetical protein JB92DRAFT_3124180 [Gautieria morchelliformis]